MMKKLMISLTMLVFLGLGASQIMATGVAKERIALCDGTEEGKCYQAYSGSYLSDCVATFTTIFCFYQDGTTRQVPN